MDFWASRVFANHNYFLISLLSDRDHSRIRLILILHRDGPHYKEIMARKHPLVEAEKLNQFNHLRQHTKIIPKYSGQVPLRETFSSPFLLSSKLVHSTRGKRKLSR